MQTEKAVLRVCLSRKASSLGSSSCKNILLLDLNTSLCVEVWSICLFCMQYGFLSFNTSYLLHVQTPAYSKEESLDFFFLLYFLRCKVLQKHHEHTNQTIQNIQVTEGQVSGKYVNKYIHNNTASCSVGPRKSTDERLKGKRGQWKASHVFSCSCWKLSRPLSEEIIQYEVKPLRVSSLNLQSSCAGLKSLSCSTHLNSRDFHSKCVWLTSLYHILWGVFVRSHSLLQYIVLRTWSASRD